MSTSKLGFGLITCQRHPDDRRPDTERYRQALELAAMADRLGFDSVWVSEHHFVDDGYCPSLLPLAAAIAVRTERCAIATGLLLAPLHEPVRIAEDAAVVDCLSGGRLLLGLGLGWRAEELRALRVSPADRVGRLRDMVATLRQGWSGQPTTGGEAVRYPHVLVTPGPARPGGPPIWIGAMGESAVRRAGRLGDGFLATEASPAAFAEQVGWALDARARAGGDPTTLAVGAVVSVFPFEGRDAFQRILPFHQYVDWKYQDMEGRAYGTDRRRLAPPRPDAAETERLRATILAGPPDQVAEGLAAYAAAAGCPVHLVARAYWPGLDPGVQAETLALLGERVLPLLDRAG